MGLLDILGQVLAAGQVSDHHFDKVAQNTPANVLGDALAGAFRSDKTPPIGDMVSQMFGNSNGQQQADVVNRLLTVLGPAVAGALANGSLGSILSPGQQQVTPEQAGQLSPEQIRDVVNEAHDREPGIADQLGAFYSEHSGLIKTLGSAALLVALGKIKDRMGDQA